MRDKRPRLNQQGLSRRSKSFMSCLLASPGHKIISCDVSSGEPSVIANYSQDPNYMQAVHGMVGKTPYYNEDHRLIIDDPYITTASVFPLWAKIVFDAFNSTYEGKRFCDMWVEDQSKVLVGPLKDTRIISKSNSLGILYGMGPKKMVEQIAGAGLELTLKQAKDFRELFYRIYPNIKKLSNKLETLNNYQGFIQNEFGYVVYPSKPHKVLNAVIQSTVSGIIAFLVKLFIEPNPWIKFISIIHDEILFEVEEYRINEARKTFYTSVDTLNKELNWTIPLRFGWVEGSNFYEAK